MGRRSVQVEVLVFTLLVMIAAAAGQSGCPSVSSFNACLAFVRNDNNVPGHDDPCCVLIRATTESCLCDTARSNNAINLQKALSLAKTCGRNVPANTYCGNVRVPN